MLKVLEFLIFVLTYGSHLERDIVEMLNYHQKTVKLFVSF
jgi:hypothetical protein